MHTACPCNLLLERDLQHILTRLYLSLSLFLSGNEVKMHIYTRQIMPFFCPVAYAYIYSFLSRDIILFTQCRAYRLLVLARDRNYIRLNIKLSRLFFFLRLRFLFLLVQLCSSFLSLFLQRLSSRSLLYSAQAARRRSATVKFEINRIYGLDLRKLNVLFALDYRETLKVNFNFSAII